MSVTVAAQSGDKLINEGNGQLSDADGLCDFVFPVDMLAPMDVLNLKIQGKDQFVQLIYI